MPNLEKTVQSWNLYFVQGPLDYPVSFHVVVGYPEVYPGVYHMKFQIFFSCSTELRLWLSPYRWTPCYWFPFWDLFENPYFKTLLQPFLEWFLQVVSNWSGPLRNWYSLLFHAADKSSSFLLSLIWSMPLNVSLNCSFIVLISGFGFFFLDSLDICHLFLE